MNIKDLIKNLQEAEDKFGNIPVTMDYYDGSDLQPIRKVEVYKDQVVISNPYKCSQVTLLG